MSNRSVTDTILFSDIKLTLKNIKLTNLFYNITITV